MREDKEIKANIDEKRKKKEEELGHMVRKRKPKAPLKVYSKVTKRPNSKIYQKLRAKIVETLKQKMGVNLGVNIIDALKEKHIEKEVI